MPILTPRSRPAGAQEPALEVPSPGGLPCGEARRRAAGAQNERGARVASGKRGRIRRGSGLQGETRKEGRPEREVRYRHNHAPSVVTYEALPSATLQCLLVCLCAREFRGSSWEEVGKAFDAHLERP
jgi:hypothetical protein